MGKCNNCVKFLTCNRTECNQVTYLQANQIDRIEARKGIELSIVADFRRFQEAVCMAGTSLKQLTENFDIKKQKGKNNG